MRPLLCLLCGLLLCAGELHADVVVVAAARAEIAPLSRDEVINIFMGRYRGLASGGAAVPIDQPAQSALRTEFYRKLVDKDLAEINAYWARLVFSGKTRPPLATQHADEALARILETPGGIGYIDRSRLDARFRLLFDPAN